MAEIQNDYMNLLMEICVVERNKQVLCLSIINVKNDNRLENDV